MNDPRTTARRRVGPYELGALLGVGGMGEVYRAVRVEDFRQTVAIKLLAHGLNDQEVQRRFHAEQQVLASLQHPNIVRLLDAGSTSDGVPYIVMEYVEGIGLDQFCEQHGLDLRARLRLMIQALGAVEYAHQRFLVHCDLKYSNILVTPDGATKLLDFGISKLLSPEQFGIGESLTQTFRPMTIEFASPEQLLAKKLSTASDIYSCGVILYGLLTGQHPFEEQLASPVAFVQAIQAGNVEAPGNRAHRIANSPVPAGLIDRDLEAITTKALRAEPESRYRSADRFAADLQRYLDGLPVEARDGTLVYRTGKFIRRNRFTAAGVVALAAALTIGVAGTVWQGVRAQRQRTRAEALFNDTRKLTGSLLFGFYDSVSKLPAATRAQQLLVREAIFYLDQLAASAAGDRDLQLDLAEGYVRLAALEGSPYVNNAGLTTEALLTADKAIMTTTPHARSLPRDQRAFLTLARARGTKGEVLLWLGRIPESVAESKMSIEILDRLVVGRPTDAEILIETASAYELYGDKISGEDMEQAMGHYQRALALFDRAKGAAPAMLRPKRAAAVLKMKLGDAISQTDPLKALEIFNEVARLLDALTQSEQEETATRRARSTLLRRRAATEVELEKLDDADRDFALVQRLHESTIAVDPGDVRAKWDLALILYARGDVAMRRKQNPVAKALFGQVVDHLQNIPGLEKSIRTRLTLAESQIHLGSLMTALREPEGRPITVRGLLELRKLATEDDASTDTLERAANAILDALPADLSDAKAALGFAERHLAKGKSSSALDIKARALLRLGEKRLARQTAREGLSMLPPTRNGVPPTRIRARLSNMSAP